ncbi:MAG: hypothetical protein R3F60_19920 [bacterium]
MSHLDLRQALEFAHYARLHRGTTFVAALGAGVAMADLLLDLKLLAAYGLPGVVVVPRPDAELAEAARLEGLPIVRVEASRPGSLRSALAMGQVPVVPVDPGDGDEGLEVEVVATRLAVELAARRLLLIRSTHPALSDELKTGHLTRDEVLERCDEPGLAGARWRHVADLLAAGLPGVVLLPGRAGCLFEELFTHDGARSSPPMASPSASARPPWRTRPICTCLLKAEMARGVVKPVSDTQIAATAHEHLVITVDGTVVGTARTGPVRGLGRDEPASPPSPATGAGVEARTLGLALIERARALGYEHLFALSVDARMWRFFESLGLAAIEREALPAAWQHGYDFSRPSRAFYRRLER